MLSCHEGIICYNLFIKEPREIYMKVLIPVLHYYPVIGGLEVWTKNIAERLSEKINIFVVTGKVKNQPKNEIKNNLRIFRTSLLSLKDLSHSSWFYIFSTWPFIFLKSLILIKKEKINLIHCQGFLSAFLGYFLFKIRKIPYIITIQRLEEKKGFFRKLVYKNAKTCIVASSAIKNYFEEIGLENIEIIPNGIDLGKFENLERRPRKEFTILTLARLEKVKGIEYLIEAISNLQPRISNLICLIIGDGSERKNLENLVKKLSLKKEIKFLGGVPYEKIPEYLMRGDCLVLPSLQEGFGIAILEAQAAGLPVIGTRIGGILDVIEDRKTGILVESKNSRAIAEAIYEIYSRPKLVQNLIKNAKINLKKYNWQDIVEKIFKIYYENYYRYPNLSS